MFLSCPESAENCHGRDSRFFPAVGTFRRLRPINSAERRNFVAGTERPEGRAQRWRSRLRGAWGKPVFRLAVLYGWPEVWRGGGRLRRNWRAHKRSGVPQGAERRQRSSVATELTRKRTRNATAALPTRIRPPGIKTDGKTAGKWKPIPDKREVWRASASNQKLFAARQNKVSGLK